MDSGWPYAPYILLLTCSYFAIPMLDPAVKEKLIFVLGIFPVLSFLCACIYAVRYGFDKIYWAIATGLSVLFILWIGLEHFGLLIFYPFMTGVGLGFGHLIRRQARKMGFTKKQKLEKRGGSERVYHQFSR